jgi:hypothetical protein
MPNARIIQVICQIQIYPGLMPNAILKNILPEFDFEKEVAQLSEIEEIKLILSPTDFGQIQSLGSYLRYSMELSTANSYTNKPAP